MPYINYRLQQPHHSISITGGEPLLYPQIILELAKNLKPLSIPFIFGNKWYFGETISSSY